jgi:HlyD family secretion protein
MKMKLTFIIAAGALIAAGGLAWSYFNQAAHEKTHLELYGNVDVRQVDLSFKIAGRLAAVNFEEGDAVKIGDIVASLEKADFEDEVKLAQSVAESRAALLDKIERGARSEEIAQTRAELDAQRAALTLAEATLKRIETLAGEDYASHQRHDLAQAERDGAAAAVAAAHEALALIESGSREEDIRAARAGLTADEATLSLAQRRFLDADLVAPNDGIILTRVREPGAIVSAGQPVYTLSLTSPVWVRTYVAEPDLGRIRPGMPAKVRTDSGGEYDGQIGFISPAAEFTPKSVETRELRTSLVYRIRVIIPNPDGGLRQGMPVTVVLQLNAAG